MSAKPQPVWWHLSWSHGDWGLLCGCPKLKSSTASKIPYGDFWIGLGTRRKHACFCYSQGVQMPLTLGLCKMWVQPQLGGVGAVRALVASRCSGSLTVGAWGQYISAAEGGPLSLLCPREPNLDEEECSQGSYERVLFLGMFSAYLFQSDDLTSKNIKRRGPSFK